jgi:bisanhydrobacterioruberin hydratase
MYPGISIKRPSIQSIGQNKVLWSTGIALLIHSVGLMGMLFFDKQWFARMTPLNLLLMFFLIVWSRPDKKISFIVFLTISFIVGMLSEVIGVQTGLLFGNYTYGSIMGYKIAEVPFIIGLNWFVIIYGAVATVHFFSLMIKPMKGPKIDGTTCSPIGVNVLIGAAILATVFDWVMEPVAISLGFWSWAGDGHIPLYNYMSWYCISTIILLIFRSLRIRPDNLFAVHLFLIQLMFFIILRASL